MKKIAFLFFMSLILGAQTAPVCFEDLYWIHYTDVCPGKKLIPGGVIREVKEGVYHVSKDDPIKNSREGPKLRFTLHGVLNGIVAPHEVPTKDGPVLMDRSHMQYAIAIPLSRLQDQLYPEGYAQDMIVVGPIDLPEESHVFYIHGAVAPHIEGVHIEEAGEYKNIFETVLDFLRKEKRPILRPLMPQKEEDYEKLKLQRPPHIFLDVTTFTDEGIPEKKTKMSQDEVLGQALRSKFPEFEWKTHYETVFQKLEQTISAYFHPLVKLIWKGEEPVFKELFLDPKTQEHFSQIIVSNFEQLKSSVKDRGPHMRRSVLIWQIHVTEWMKNLAALLPRISEKEEIDWMKMIQETNAQQAVGHWGALMGLSKNPAP